MTTEDKKELLEYLDWNKQWHKKELVSDKYFPNKKEPCVAECHLKNIDKYDRMWEAVAQIEVKDE